MHNTENSCSKEVLVQKPEPFVCQPGPEFRLQTVEAMLIGVNTENM